MSDKPENATDLQPLFVRMSEMWRESLEQSQATAKLWTDSMMPFLSARAADSSLFAAAQGAEISEAIKRMVEGPRLADVWDLDRRLHELMGSWIEVQQRIAAYRAVVTVPWNRAFDRFSKQFPDQKMDGDWRAAFSVWSGIANEELTSNQRSDEFLTAQRELLRAALDLRTRQQAFADLLSELFGQPTRRDFDELARQLTEVRRELRAFARMQRPAAEQRPRQERSPAQKRPERGKHDRQP